MIGALNADARLISLSGLLAGYVLSSGDYLGFAYRSDPARYALHRIWTPQVEADAQGTTPSFTVQPPLRPGADVGAAVTFERAACKAIIRPGSVEPGRTRRFTTEGMAFSFVQTLR